MNYDLKRPCPKCPFRFDVPGYLTGERAEEIADAVRAGRTFQCHETVEWSDEDDDEPFQTDDGGQHCAGALIMLEHMGEIANGQLTRIMMRLGMFDPDALDMTAPVFDDAEDFIAHHEEADARIRA